jgi:subtilisin family serine protease
MAQLETALGSDKTMIDLWSNIQGEELWKGRTGRGVRVGIVDSGIDTAHPELAGKIKASYQAVNEGGQIVFKESTTGDQAVTELPAPESSAALHPTLKSPASKFSDQPAPARARCF